MTGPPVSFVSALDRPPPLPGERFPLAPDERAMVERAREAIAWIIDEHEAAAERERCEQAAEP